MMLMMVMLQKHKIQKSASVLSLERGQKTSNSKCYCFMTSEAVEKPTDTSRNFNVLLKIPGQKINDVNDANAV